MILDVCIVFFTCFQSNQQSQNSWKQKRLLIWDTALSLLVGGGGLLASESRLRNSDTLAVYQSQWHMAPTDRCQCGDVQTMIHIVESCPLTRFADVTCFGSILLMMVQSRGCKMLQRRHSRNENQSQWMKKGQARFQHATSVGWHQELHAAVTKMCLNNQSIWVMAVEENGQGAAHNSIACVVWSPVNSLATAVSTGCPWETDGALSLAN